jgi:hypothetical protein
MSGGKILDQIEIQLRDRNTNALSTVYIDVFENSLSRKWLMALNQLLINNYHLEKNYCFFGFADSERNGKLILDQVNNSINAINCANLEYTIDDYFSMENCFYDIPGDQYHPVRNMVQEKFNALHRYFEDLQGVSGSMSPYYNQADAITRWHIRQLNLLCHEFETWALSYRKQAEGPEWQRPSTLMCWLHAPRFMLDHEDYELFGIETMNRSLGGVFIGVNKAVGKHHWEVFHDEGRDSRIDELTTSTMRSQTEAAGDFDIEWGNNPGNFIWQQVALKEFREWLITNGFDPEDKSLTIGHPQVGQVDLMRSFGSDNYLDIWKHLNTHLDVYSVKTSDVTATYEYHWSDADFMQRQIAIIEKGHTT